MILLSPNLLVELEGLSLKGFVVGCLTPKPETVKR